MVQTLPTNFQPYIYIYVCIYIEQFKKERNQEKSEIGLKILQRHGQPSPLVESHGGW